LKKVSAGYIKQKLPSIELSPKYGTVLHIMTVKLEVTKRTTGAKAVRKQGLVPAIVYGPKQEPISVAVPKTVFEKVLKEAGESTVIYLTGLGEEVEVLIHDVSFNSAKGGVEHADFYAIEKGKEITVDVPLEFVGEAPATKVGGSLTKVLHEIEITCKPSALPQHITVDVSVLDDFEKQIHVRDLVIPKGVTVENDGDEVVALVQEVKEEIAPEVAVDMAAIEVETKGKTEEKEA
jgi:large subunit ribosomal protein L25